MFSGPAQAAVFCIGEATGLCAFQVLDGRTTIAMNKISHHSTFGIYTGSKAHPIVNDNTFSENGLASI
jgi:hypothetical protein